MPVVHRRHAVLVKVAFDAFGPKAYSYGLVHYMTYQEDLACGGYKSHEPLLTVHKDEPTSCFRCLVIGDPRRND